MARKSRKTKASSGPTVTPRCYTRDVDDVCKHTRLTRRGAVYWFRAKVPVDLRDHYAPKREITYSLRTKDPATALEKVRIESVKLDQEFKRLRRLKAAQPLDSLSEAEIERLAAIYLNRLLTEDDELRLEGAAAAGGAIVGFSANEARRSRGMSDREFVKIDETASILADGMKTALARGDTSLIEDEVDDLLEANGLKLERRSEGYRKLGLAILRATVKANEMVGRRLQGDVVETPPAPAPLRPLVQDNAGDDIPFSVLWERYRDERKLPEKTASDFGAYVRRFIEINGDLPAKQITKAHIRHFKDVMLKVPSRLDHKTRKLTVPQLLEKFEGRDDVPRLSARTVNDKALGAISAVLSYGADNGYRDDNPASGVKVATGEVQADPRLPYDASDLSRIFSFPVFTSGERPVAGGGEAAKWLPLLALFTGARLEELGQCRVADVKVENGIPFLDLRVIEQGKALKRDSSRRMVPVHPELIRCGFLQYVQQQRKAGGERLFPDLKSERSKLTAAWSQWWGRYARKHGITDKRKVFHSFRHTFKDACRAAGIEEAIYDALQGHKGGSVGRSYGLGYPVSVLAKAVEKVQYPGLDLRHLYLDDGIKEVG
jgi:integrase